MNDIALITRPLLAHTIEDTSKIEYPVFATPKLDGIRTLIVNGKCLSRSFKAIPNDYIRTKLEKDLGHLTLDGELILPGKEFNEISSAIMTKDGEPEFEYHVFDIITDKGLDEAYCNRMSYLSAVSLPEYVIKVLPTPMFCLEDLTLATQSAIDSGYEGLMIRRKDSKYKCGRSTEKQGILGKIKLFKDSEARIVGIEELMVNNNPVTEDEFGLAKRSSHKVNLVGSGTLGSLELEDIYSGIRFSIGTGFTSAQREQLWVEKNNLLSKIIKYKYQGEGMVEKPRFPVFLGFRHEDDL